jgi:hypothetical protein
MLSAADLERERLQARRKWQLDYNAGMTEARMEGVMAGEEIGVIRVCQNVLGQPVTPHEALLQLPAEELTLLAERFRKEAIPGR